MMTNIPSFPSLLLLFAVSLPAWADNSADLQRLYQQGQYQQAYERAQSIRSQSEGQPGFDYIYGLIALQSGHSGEAVFALERVLLNQPGHSEARLALGKGYLTLGQSDLAKAAFQRVLDSTSEGPLRQEALGYLEQTKGQAMSARTQVAAFTQATYGYDSNVNSSTDDPFFTSPIFVTPNRRIADQDLAQSDNFIAVGLGSQITHRVNDQLAFFAGVGVEKRDNSTVDRFDMTTQHFNLGLNISHMNHQIRLSREKHVIKLGTFNYREQNALTADWSYLLSPDRSVNAFAQAGEIVFENQRDRDADTVSFGLGGTLQTHGTYTPLFSGMVFVGDDDNVLDNAENRSESDKSSLGLMLNSHLTLTERDGLDLSFIYQKVRHQAPDTLFLTKRKDDYARIGLRYTRRLNGHWKAMVDLSHSEQDSNLDVHDFDRNQASVSIRYDY